MVGLRTGFLLFNTPFSFSLHFLSKTQAICIEGAKAGLKSDFLTVLFFFFFFFGGGRVLE